MPVTHLQPQRTWGSAIGKALMSYMIAKERRRKTGLEEKQFGLDSALRQAQTQNLLARTEALKAPGLTIKDIAGLIGRSRGVSPPTAMTDPFQGAVQGGIVDSLQGIMPKADTLAPGAALPTPQRGEPQGLGGYDKPIINFGEGGKVRGMTFRPKAQYPEGYQADIAQAISAIDRAKAAGKDIRIKVYQRIAAQYPEQSTELKRILLYTPASGRLEALREALFGGE